MFSFFWGMKKMMISGLLFTILLVSVSSRMIPVYTTNDLTGRFAPESHADFVPVASAYTINGTYMRKEAYDALVMMFKAASRDGVNLVIVSGTRNHARQTEIWSEKWNRLTDEPAERARAILTYSSMPGTSRHHWGTDIDLNSVEPEYFETTNGKKVYAWLQENAIKFGYFQPYIVHGDARETGYNEEKWHWSYYPIADQLLRAYKRMIGYQYINGFPGSEYAPQLNVIEHFVQGIPDGPEAFVHE
jgi:LAS superfamily LD-carboxypeptidase LdcB